MSRRGPLPALSLLALLGAPGCTPSAREQEIEFRVPVSVQAVETGAVEDRIVATGTLRSLETVTLVVETPGVFRCGRSADGRRLAEGDRVQAGQTVAEITGEDVRLAARTEATQRRYETALRDFESSKALFAEGLITEIDFRRVEAQLAEAKLDWERSRLTEDRNRLVTPISGVLLRLARDAEGRPIPDGQRVLQGLAVAQIAPIERLIADVDLVGPDFSRVRAGQTARVRHYAYEDRRFEGRVVRLAPTLDPATRTFRAEVEIDNREALLRPGMFVEVTLIAERRENVPVIPRVAVSDRGGAKVVFVLQGQKVSRREVALGLGDDEIVEVRHGLAVGERVVVKGLETLTEGSPVRMTGS
jgi:RND family efflux transporter MFP subunit